MQSDDATAQHAPLTFFIAGLAHETNSFSPLPTSMRSFQVDVCYSPPAVEGRDTALAFAGYGDAIAVARGAGDRVIEGPCFWTQPAGPISAPLYAELSGALLDQLRRAGPVDGVILSLHGAMMVQGLDDAEGDLLHRVRQMAGADIPIGALLDLHGNVGAAMIESGALLVGVKEYPHTDFRERAGELHAMLSAAARNRKAFLTTLRTVPVLTLQGTTEEPMRGLVLDLVEAEKTPGVHSVTLMHGFPWSDTAATGASVIVIAEPDAAAASERLAIEVGERFRTVVTGAPVTRVDVPTAVVEAMARPGGHNGPVMIADSSDNPGGGAGCDSTFLLRALIDSGCGNAALGMIWDPQTAQIAADAGVGARLALRIGGKVGPLSGDPVDVVAEVLAVREDAKQRFFSDTPNSPLGLAVALRIGGIELVVNSVRQQVFSPECFTELGIDVAAKAIVVVKSSQHFRAGFDAIASTTIYCNAPGSLNLDLASLPYRKIKVTQDGGAYAIDVGPETIQRLSLTPRNDES